jgi:hypothetical protein
MKKAGVNISKNTLLKPLAAGKLGCRTGRFFSAGKTWVKFLINVSGGGNPQKFKFQVSKPCFPDEYRNGP